MKYILTRNLVSLLILIACSNPILAFQENSGVWGDISLYDHIDGAEKFSYFLEGELRFLDEANYYDLAYLHGGFGYNYKPTTSFWAGYEWYSHSPLENTPAQNLLFAEFFSQLYQNDSLVLRKRGRYEQIKAQHESDWEYRYRGKFYLYLTVLNTDVVTPLIYDEIFVKFNNPSWDATSTFQQNWLFLGADIEVSDAMFLEVGYIQQYVFGQQEDRANNILYLGINFNPLMVPVYEYVR